ncbi:type II secretion system protein [Bacillus sp. FJAT-27245]|uniref:type II secretion system protein n=1 Tax=Bacillus sp. FJAT-27245 TaxID=1684144 RepID=UPI0009E9CF7D|nr:type II secretion system protein [Bacillus sp. FJAT-27245]
MFKNLKKKMKDQRGLTLIELLAVIVILGIIAAIAVPSIGGLISKSKDDAKVAEALQIISAAKLAHASNSKITTWDNDGVKATVSGVEVDAGKIGDMVENVKDPDYIVTYKDKKYFIINHDSEKVVKNTETGTTLVSEEDLLKHSGN